ncbi:predicted protein [Plenodomus lingam JN3]|uniref:Uncharacterized protein n=1 Tax=Leptosphaeria maculans (strain JN3 / isolate v23.1.3 / race Av1-4-5-6-7-8) TaxID=985895 RepID=E4ZGP3_LEPMJ|nr:predicted protein [Plenodomus lingam JN3]CBX90463.1 predicted protein [Plenodomus lingam JN3]
MIEIPVDDEHGVATKMVYCSGTTGELAPGFNMMGDTNFGVSRPFWDHGKAYTSNPSGRHGGGLDPNTSTSIQASSIHQGPKVHLGGGNFDPNSPSSRDSVTVQPLPIERPNFNAQATHSYPVG